MTVKKVFAAVLMAVMVVLASMEAQQPPAAVGALTGTVRSAKEGLMEGVLVSARRNGSPITTTVVTNAQGVYAFPKDRLEAGRYDVSIRAVGYVLNGPAPKASVNVTAGSATPLNLNLNESNPL